MDAQLALDLDLDLAEGSLAADVSPFPGRVVRPTHQAPADGDAPRPAELMVALSRALDMAGGQAAGHAQRSCWIGQRIGRALGLDSADMRDLFDATLLKDAGGSSNASRVRELLLVDDQAFERHRKTLGTSLPALLRFMLSHAVARAPLADRLRAALQVIQQGGEIARELTEARGARGAQVARQLRFSDDVADAIQNLDEHWDGSGQPQGLSGAEIPLVSRIAQLAQFVDVVHTRAGARAAREAVARRRGRWFDPRLADVFAVLAHDPDFWRQLDADGLEDRLLAAAPPRARPVDEDMLDDVALAFGQIADAKSACTGGHSARVALVAGQLASDLGLGADRRRWLRRAALLHDVGKLGVSSAILDKPGRLDPWEWTEVQRHALFTEQVLGRIGAFAALARVAGAHHERLDGGGYPRGLDARHIRLETRIITAADIFDALTADRPWRAAMPVDAALRVMHGMVGSQVDGDCLGALRRVVGATPAH